MATPIAMPKLGLTMSEGKVLEWPIPLGGAVAKGQTVLLIESEKAEVEVEATASGVLRHVYVEPDPDALLPCGSLLAAITESPDEAFDAEAFYKENHHPEETESAGAGAAPTAEASVAEARAEEVVEWLRAIGTVHADQRVELSAEVGGRLAEITAEVGDLVAAGDLLARLDDERLRVARDLARAEVGMARANLENSRRDA